MFVRQIRVLGKAFIGPEFFGGVGSHGFRKEPKKALVRVLVDHVHS